ncbi:hypothetical protein AJ80_08830 [Polytolypa hystricis UAMH7299]|uniref:Restriction of telomere capping protein 4 n=1 Tax=Polytolypa hystricis (strain UAMH7299) TaxID=1447883 RepID=A0A2B7X1P6_POLH7|nr:hypothetical protein AJ80_08830 [Polytolypa hystricis UAMH7299]
MDPSWEVFTPSDFASKFVRTANPPALPSPLPVFPYDRFSPSFSQPPPPQTYNAPSITHTRQSHPLPRRFPSPCDASAASPCVQPASGGGGGEHYPPGAGGEFDALLGKGAITARADANESNPLACVSPSHDSNEGGLSKSDRRHRPEDTPHGNEDGAFEDADSNPSSTASIPTGSVPLCSDDASPQHGLATDNRQTSSSEPSRDPWHTPAVHPSIMVEPDDSTVDGSSLCSDSSPRSRPSSSCATSISGSPAPQDGDGKADTVGGRPTSPLPLRNRPSRSGGMQPMVAVQVPLITHPPVSETSSPRGPMDKFRSRTQSPRKPLAQSTREVPASRKRKRDDNTSIAVLGISSDDSDGSDNEYLASSSEEESCAEKPSKVRKLFPQPRRTVSPHRLLQCRSPIRGADHRRVPDTECPSTVERKGGHLPPCTQKGQAFLCWLEKLDHTLTALTTASCCAHPPTAVSGVGRVAENDRAVEHNREGRRRTHWTTGEDDCLAELRGDGFTWSQIEERFPDRSPSSLRQRYTKLKKRSSDIPRRPSRERPQVDDDLAKPAAKPRPPRPSTSITVCPMCKCTVDAQALGYPLPVDPNRMRFREQREFCDSHRRETARREWFQRGYPSIEWGRLDDRLHDYHSRLRCVLDPRYSSQYKQALDKIVEEYGRESLSKGMLHSAGYYGPRGDTLLWNHIIYHFSRDIDSLAKFDGLVSKCGGTVNYAQEVLVPELLVMLVQDDMGVNAEEAVQILEESDKIGVLLNCE